MSMKVLGKEYGIQGNVLEQHMLRLTTLAEAGEGVKLPAKLLQRVNKLADHTAFFSVKVTHQEGVTPQDGKELLELASEAPIRATHKIESLSLNGDKLGPLLDNHSDETALRTVFIKGATAWLPLGSFETASPQYGSEDYKLIGTASNINRKEFAAAIKRSLDEHERENAEALKQESRPQETGGAGGTSSGG